MAQLEIDDLSNAFFQSWEKLQPFTLDDLERYYQTAPEVFNHYFQQHCQRTPERLGAALERYPEQIATMKRAAELLPSLIEEVYERLSNLMGLEMTIKTRLLVGCFGSNAYVTHDGTLHFALETMPDNPDYLTVLVAHEMAHAFHFEMLGNAGFDFSKMAGDGYTSIYLEGVATVVSELVKPGLSEKVYFSFDETSEAWLTFFKEHFIEVKKAIQHDLKHWKMEEEREWFRLRGGKKYGYNRLGYLLGRVFVKQLIQKTSLKETMIYWARHDLKQEIEDWMDEASSPITSGGA
ncbi:hypothetical protein PU629_09410 [Pullulanibacillus sp. KACC 23026]|uniref:DUF5700 domain-containing putative Zn-dependent protease n=1 Tax=Pullulanibacillus sp. KACC 23026 TaxID=3028315 RepID=UPI0023B11016|nr:DUF5700 domain-containing putative Zn-dependent protease [Pullulanibacillus sp. KACC 23026]WEG14552.1 hypothetical protein PU629_09410 [Pullulanibacillus sp. KACC 23026]